MKNWKRLFSCVLIVCMLVSLSPAVFAADDSSEPVQIADGESVTVEMSLLPRAATQSAL